MAKSIKKMYKELILNNYIEKGRYSDEEIRRLHSEMIYDESFIDERTGGTLKFINEEEDDIMKQENSTSTNNKNKEETVMKKFTEAFNKAATNQDKAQVLYVMLDTIEAVTNVHAGDYVKKDALVAFAKDLGMVINRKTSRVDALSFIRHHANKLSNITDTIANDEVKDNTQHETPNTDTKAKTDKLFALIKASAESNKKKGYGYTISSFMLQACILEAGAGIKKFKGHTVTKEEAEMTKRIYKYLLSKGFIKPVVYSVKEDANVRIYMPEYTGKTESAKTKLIPYNKSGSYTAKQITSFAVYC